MASMLLVHFVFFLFSLFICFSNFFNFFANTLSAYQGRQCSFYIFSPLSLFLFDFLIFLMFLRTHCLLTGQTVFILYFFSSLALFVSFSDFFKFFCEHVCLLTGQTVFILYFSLLTLFTFVCIKRSQIGQCSHTSSCT